MSLQLSPKAPARTIATGYTESWATVPTWARNEPSETPSPFGVACRDVMDEVRQRMAVRGYSWE